MGAIFISYRRDDTEGQAGRLFEDLSREFGKDAVFMDVAAIEPGRDFRRVIDQQVAACGVLLALVGRKWIDAVDESGARRLDDPLDFVRLETASALRRDIPVVPVLVHGARMPRAEQLPEDLKEFAFRNAVELTHARWESDVQVLVRALRPYAQPLGAADVAPRDQPDAAGRRRMPMVIAAAAVAAMGGGVAWWQFGGTAGPKPDASPPLESRAGPADAAPKLPASAPSSASSIAMVSDEKKPVNPKAGSIRAPDTRVAASRPKPPLVPDRGTETREADKPKPEPAPAARVNLKGVWPAQACDLVIEKDDGKVVAGVCDTGIEHRFVGRYVSDDTASIILTRIDRKTPCTLTDSGTIKILGPDIIEFRQNGWKGCNPPIDTGPYVTRLKRK